jgi:hypothetical protein
MRRLQASGDINSCLGGTADNSVAGTQRCDFSGSSGACIQKSSNADVVQICKFIQGPSVPAKNNLAIALQVIVQKGPGSGDQHGRQLVKVRQQNTTKSNLAFVAQFVKQSLGNGWNDSDNEMSNQAGSEARGELQGTLPDFGPVISQVKNSEVSTEGDETAALSSPSGPVSQIQNSQQTVRICQGGPDCTLPAGMTGSNLSSVYQSLRQRERAANAESINQQQNPEPGTCPVDSTDPSDPTSLNPRNMCASVAQNTTGGKNVSGLAELYRQFQSGAHTADLTQEQDPSFSAHGLDHDIQQLSLGDVNGPKRNTIVTFQLARQVQRAKDAAFLNQFQDPRTAKGPDSFQTGTVNDTWFGRQFATQLQFTDGALATHGQEQILTYDGQTTGNFDVVQTGTTQDSSFTNTCSGQFCFATVECFGGEGPAVCSGGGDSITSIASRGH